MSMTALRFRCDLCGFAASSMVNWGVFKYVIGDKELPVSRELGWCSECGTIRPIEVVPTSETLKTLYLQCEVAREQLSSAAPWPLRIFRSGSLTKSDLAKLRTDLARLEEDLRVLEPVVAALADRRAGPRCLLCESEAISKLPECDAEEADDLNQEEVALKVFPHPGCAGYIWVSRPSILFSVAIKKRTYDREGHLLSTVPAYPRSGS